MSQEYLLKLHKRIVKKLSSQLFLHMQLVDSYSFAEAVMYDSYDAEFVLNDYLHFCYAKSTKTGAAIELLVHANFREDAFILLRANYENYLSFWYVLRNPESIDSFVTAKVGKSNRRFAHPKKGPSRHLKVIDTISGEEYLYGRSMSKLARNSSPRVSIDFHELFYEYLCEFTHTHFMAFGDYLDPRNLSKITARNYGVNLEVVTYSLLLSTMWLESFMIFEEVDPMDARRIRSGVKSGRDLLLEIETVLHSEGKLEMLLSEIRKMTESLGGKIVL